MTLVITSMDSKVEQRNQARRIGHIRESKVDRTQGSGTGRIKMDSMKRRGRLSQKFEREAMPTSLKAS